MKRHNLPASGLENSHIAPWTPSKAQGTNGITCRPRPSPFTTDPSFVEGTLFGLTLEESQRKASMFLGVLDFETHPYGSNSFCLWCFTLDCGLGLRRVQLWKPTKHKPYLGSRVYGGEKANHPIKNQQGVTKRIDRPKWHVFAPSKSFGSLPTQSPDWFASAFRLSVGETTWSE